MDEIGDILKQAREEKDYSLNDIQQITKIQKRYLVAIEEGNFDALPGDFYTRAFIRQYADVVGIDSAELLEQHSKEVPKVQADIEKKATSTATNSTTIRQTNESRDSFLRSNLPKIFIFVLILAILLALYYAWSHRENDTDSVIQGSNEISVQVSSSEEVTQATSASDDTDEDSSEEDSSEDSSSSENAEDFSVELDEASGSKADFSLTVTSEKEIPLTVEADGDDSWISISQDNDNLFQGTLSDGEKNEQDISADTKEIAIRLGNAPASIVKIDGKEVPMPEENEEAITQDWTFTVESK